MSPPSARAPDRRSRLNARRRKAAPMGSTRVFHRRLWKTCEERSFSTNGRCRNSGGPPECQRTKLWASANGSGRNYEWQRTKVGVTLFIAALTGSPVWAELRCSITSSSSRHPLAAEIVSRRSRILVPPTCRAAGSPPLHHPCFPQLLEFPSGIPQVLRDPATTGFYMKFPIASGWGKLSRKCALQDRP